MPLSEGPGIAVSVDYFGAIPVMPRSITYILLFTDRFSRRVDIFAVTTVQPSSQLGARLTLSSTGIFPSGDARAAYSRTTASSFVKNFRVPSTSFLGFGKLPPAPTTQMAMGVERLNHTMAQMLAMVVNKLQNTGMSSSLTLNLCTTFRSALLPD